MRVNNVRFHRLVLGTQSTYYIASGVWPLLSRRSFERVTGPKTDFWLVQTVGLLIVSIGVGLARSARYESTPGPAIASIGVTAAAALALMDVVNVGRRRISRVYLLDAAAEAALLTGWLFIDRRRS